MKNISSTKLQKISFWLILLLTILTRLPFLGSLPAGLNQDEAFSGYEAWSLFTTHRDSWLNPFPLYFISWGSGMNILYSYLTLPFIALFDLNTFSLRFAQSLFGILSCYIFYRLLRTKYNKTTSLFGYFLSAIIPWHIMLSRFALESNIAPFFILTALYFYLRSYKKDIYLILSAIFYGLGMYAYATCWIYISLTFALQLSYYIYIKKH